MINVMLEWTLKAECRGTSVDLFFPERGESTAQPKSICKRCPVKQECLDYALENNERFGIWGGLSERERRAYKKHQKDPSVPIDWRGGLGTGQYERRYGRTLAEAINEVRNLIN